MDLERKQKQQISLMQDADRIARKASLCCLFLLLCSCVNRALAFVDQMGGNVSRPVQAQVSPPPSSLARLVRC